MTTPDPFSLASAAAGGPLRAQAADEARERAIRLLTDAYAYDVITDIEFERLLGQLGLAATRDTIDAVVADLPTAPYASRETLRTDAMPEGSAGRITGFMSETRRTGSWSVPRHLTVRAVMCDMKIDLRYAAIPGNCSIDVTAIMSSVALVVPPGLAVDFNIDPILGVAGSAADAGYPGGVARVHIRGSAIMSDVRVRVRQLGR